MEERSGSLGNSGFDTGFFTWQSGGFFNNILGLKLIQLASQSVFICEDDHMLYDFKVS